MDDDKRRKKNKKKKNKHSKNVENGVPGVGGTAIRDQDLINDGCKAEHAHLLETTNELSTNVASNGVGETETRDQNLVNNGEREPAHLPEIAEELQSTNGVGETPNRNQNLVKDETAEHLESIDGQSTNTDSNGHLPNGKECVSFPSVNIDFHGCLNVYALESSAIPIS